MIQLREFIVAMGMARIPWPLESYLDMTDRNLDAWDRAVRAIDEAVEEKVNALLQKRGRK